jgi:hypothetical protein
VGPKSDLLELPTQNSIKFEQIIIGDPDSVLKPSKYTHASAFEKMGHYCAI